MTEIEAELFNEMMIWLDTKGGRDLDDLFIYKNTRFCVIMQGKDKAKKLVFLPEEYNKLIGIEGYKFPLIYDQEDV